MEFWEVNLRERLEENLEDRIYIIRDVPGLPIEATKAWYIDYCVSKRKEEREAMESWERELRDKLEKELPEGSYQIGSGKMIAWTGKGGKINFEVALHRHAKSLTSPGGTFNIPLDSKPSDSSFTLDNFRKELYTFFNKTPMTWPEYLPLAEKTMSLEFHAPEPVQRVLHGVIGICTEIGELYEGLTVNKPGAEFDLDHPDVINLKEEIGDCYWYLAIVHREFEEFQQPDPDTSFTPNKGVPTEFILRELTVSSSILLDLMKKKLFYNKTLDIEQFVIQTRHIEYYLECLTLNHDLVKEEILETNINKLKARYGEKFSSEKAIERNLDTERTVLEEEAPERSGRSLAAQANETAAYFDKAGPANFKEGGEAPSIDPGYKTSLAPLVEGEVIEAEHKIGVDFSPFKVRLKKITNDRYVRFAGWRCVINDLDPETKIATMVMLNNKADNFLGYFKKKEETE